MKLRLARKLLCGKRSFRCRQRAIQRLRKSYYNAEGRWCTPSFANNPRIMKAWTVVKRHMRYNQYIDKPIRHRQRN